MTYVFFFPMWLKPSYAKELFRDMKVTPQGHTCEYAPGQSAVCGKPAQVLAVIPKQVRSLAEGAASGSENALSQLVNFLMTTPTGGLPSFGWLMTHLCEEHAPVLLRSLDALAKAGLLRKVSVNDEDLKEEQDQKGGGTDALRRHLQYLGIPEEFLPDPFETVARLTENEIDDSLETGLDVEWSARRLLGVTALFIEKTKMVAPVVPVIVPFSSTGLRFDVITPASQQEMHGALLSVPYYPKIGFILVSSEMRFAEEGFETVQGVVVAVNEAHRNWMLFQERDQDGQLKGDILRLPFTFGLIGGLLSQKNHVKIEVEVIDG